MRTGIGVLGAEGNVGVLYEHSPAEGPPVAALVDFCAKQASTWVIPAEVNSTEPEPLEFFTNVQVRLSIQIRSYFSPCCIPNENLKHAGRDDDLENFLFSLRLNEI